MKYVKLSIPSVTEAQKAHLLSIKERTGSTINEQLRRLIQQDIDEKDLIER